MPTMPLVGPTSVETVRWRSTIDLTAVVPARVRTRPAQRSTPRARRERRDKCCRVWHAPAASAGAPRAAAHAAHAATSPGRCRARTVYLVGDVDYKAFTVHGGRDGKAGGVVEAGVGPHAIRKFRGARRVACDRLHHLPARVLGHEAGGEPNREGTGGGASTPPHHHVAQPVAGVQVFKKVICERLNRI